MLPASHAIEVAWAFTAINQFRLRMCITKILGQEVSWNIGSEQTSAFFNQTMRIIVCKFD